MTRLVIVESPAKARTIAGYLGSDYAVESSIGHIRDLPERAKDVPKEKRTRYGKLGVDVEHGFEPYYVVDADKKRVVADLKKKLAESDELLLATDEDREGEAIAWHLREVLKPKVPVRRMVFHEITKDAIQRALDETRDDRRALVDAQETRRILDRLYGYEVSPVLWKKVMPRLSAGRVQSVATRLVVDRERERMRFVAAAYWDILGTFEPGAFDARLSTVEGKRVAQGRDFGEDGTPASAAILVLDEEAARSLAGARGPPVHRREGRREAVHRRPAAPFRTSTLQQEASRKLRFSSQTTMRLAQRLYENGHITYMRTDSVTLSDTALNAARAHAARVYGAETVPAEPRRYERAVANAQEAHEAIRPAGDVFRTPDELRGELSRDELALYDLVFKRTVASQMKDASGQTVSIELGATHRGRPPRDVPGERHRDHLSRVPQGVRVGPRRADGRGRGAAPARSDGRPDARGDGPGAAGPRDEPARPVHRGEPREGARGPRHRPPVYLRLDHGHDPRPRLRLQEGHRARADVRRVLGDAAPREALRPARRLRLHRALEDDLDRIAAGNEERVAWLKRFYFGDGDPGLHALVTDHLEGIDARDVNSIPIPGSDIVVRVGRYGPISSEASSARASLTTSRPTSSRRRAPRSCSRSPPGPSARSGHIRSTGREIAAKDGRYGPYVTEVLPEGEDGKPRTASLFSSMSLDTITLDDAVRCSRSRGRSRAPTGGDPRLERALRAVRQAGIRDAVARVEEQLLTLTVEQAEAVLAQPKQRRGRGHPSLRSRSSGADPQSGKPLVVKDGRFGRTSRTVRRTRACAAATTPEALTLERAVELLAERRAKSA